MIWNLKRINEEIDAELAKIDAILAIAAEEKREPTAEESAEIDAIQGTETTQGTLQKLQAHKARIVRHDTIKAANLGRHIGGHQVGGDEPGMVTGIEAPKAIKVPATAKRHGRVKHFKGPNAEADAYVTGRFLMAVIGNHQQSKAWLQDHGVKMIHTSDENDKGGFLVPEVLENALIDLKEEFGMFRQYAMNWPMTSDTSLVPRRVSGFVTYFVGQGQEITPSTMKLDQVRLEAKKLAALTKFSSELNEDSIISVADLYAREFAYALSLREDELGFLGDGTSSSGGIVGLQSALNTGSISIATGITAASNLTLANFHNVKAKLPRFRGIQPAWYCNSAFYEETMARLQVAAGGNTVTDVANGAVERFLGAPVRFIEVLPDTAATNVKVAYYGDLAMAATMGTRRGVTLSADSSVFFTSDALALKVTERFDINVHERGTETKAGPIIAMQMG